MKLKIFRGFISVVFVSFALFGGSHPPAAPPKPLENLVVKILEGMLSCDNKSAIPSTPSQPSSATGTPSTASSTTQIKDDIKSQIVKGDKTAADAVSAVVADFESVVHRQKGDDLLLKNRFTEAQSEYNKALESCRTDTKAGKSAKAKIYNRLSAVSIREARRDIYRADSTNNPQDKADLYELVSRKFREAASYNRQSAALVEGKDKEGYLWSSEANLHSANNFAEHAASCAQEARNLNKP